MLALLLSVTAFAGTLVNCDYKVMSFPASQVSLGFEGNQPEDFVTVTMQGRSHRESFTPAEAHEGEMIRGWLSLESEENSIEMVVYKERQPLGLSKLVNFRVPFGKEIWGECDISGRAGLKPFSF